MRLDSQLVFHLTLLLAKCLDGATSVVGKIVLNTSGIPVLLVHLYTSICSCFFFFLVAFFSERNKLPLRNRKVQIQVLAAGSLNYLAQLTGTYALNYTSPELVSIIYCTIPIMASVIAIIYRVENVRLKRYDGQVKVLGVVVACAGSLVMAIFQGSKILGMGISQWHLGWFLATLCSLFIAVSVNIQAPVLKTYQAPWSVISAVTITNMSFSALTCMVFVRPWTLPSLEALLGLAFSGAIGGGVATGLTSWVISKGGLMLVNCYLALSPICATILSILILGTSLYLGSVLGAMLVICGVILCGWSEIETKKLASLDELLIP